MVGKAPALGMGCILLLKGFLSSASFLLVWCYLEYISFISAAYGLNQLFKVSFMSDESPGVSVDLKDVNFLNLKVGLIMELRLYTVY